MEGKPPIGKVLEFYGADLQTIRGYGQWKSILCPFHPDTTASARVNEAFDGFKCMACDIAGDSWSIIMDREGVRFPEAVRFAEANFNHQSDRVSEPVRRRRPYSPSWS